MAIGLSPETVDAGFTAEFAVTVVKNNILLSKRVLQIQQIFTPQVTDSVQKIVLNDHEIIDSIIEILKENHGILEKSLSDDEKEDFKADENKFYKDFTEVIVSNLSVDLPKPDITTLDNLSSSFDEYQTALEKTLESWISTDILNENVAGELSGSVDVIKQTLKAYFLRKWMSENGFMPELSDMVSTDEDERPMINIETIMASHVEGLTRSSIDYLNKLKANKEAATKDMTTLNAGEVESSGFGESESSGTEPSENSGGEFDLGGDMDLGNETKETEAPNEESTSEAEKPNETTEEPESTQPE